MQNQSNSLPWTEADEAFIRKISGFIQEGLTNARSLPAEEWELVPVSRRADELASVIFFAFENRRKGSHLRSVT